MFFSFFAGVTLALSYMLMPGIASVDVMSLAPGAGRPDTTEHESRAPEYYDYDYGKQSITSYVRQCSIILPMSRSPRHSQSMLKRCLKRSIVFFGSLFPIYLVIFFFKSNIYLLTHRHKMYLFNVSKKITRLAV